MARTMILAAMLACGASFTAAAANIQLEKGQLTRNSPYATQVLAVKNNSGAAVQSVEIECGFLQGQRVLAVGTGYVQNVAAGQRAYAQVIGDNAAAADSADCRIVEVE